MKRYFSLFVSALLILSLFTGCGSSSSDSYSGDSAMMEEAYDEMAPQDQALNSSAEPGSTQLPANRKWVITSEMRAETHEMDAALDAVNARVSEMQGYVEDQHFENGSYYGDYDTERSARMTIRVPAEHVDDFMETMKEHANVISSSKNLQDITLQYTDTETRIAALKAEEARLLEFMEQAETMNDLLEIERRLTDVHYELENVTSRLRTYDNQVNYATIHLTINEVKVYTPVEQPGFLERITTGFMESVHGVWNGIVEFVIELIVCSPYLVIYGGIIAVVVVLAIRSNKKAAAKKAAAKKKNPEAEVQEIPAEWKNFDQPVKKEDGKKKP